jgi:uncharacterized YigZ family protein
MSSYYTLISKKMKGADGELAQGFLQEKKSKFISYIFNIKNKEDACKYIENLRVKHKEARHIVYIYTYIDKENVNIKFSDDGEPQGTGTRAIYELLIKENITNICIVIVRYFGGILLGAGPLSRAYLNSAKEAILACTKVKFHNYININIITSYDNYSQIKYICNTFFTDQVKTINTSFDKDIKIEFMVQDKIVDEFKSKIKEYIIN